MISTDYLIQILNEIAQHKIKIYEFPECDDEEENKLQKKLLKVCLFHSVFLLLIIIFFV